MREGPRLLNSDARLGSAHPSRALNRVPASRIRAKSRHDVTSVTAESECHDLGCGKALEVCGCEETRVCEREGSMAQRTHVAVWHDLFVPQGNNFSIKRRSLGVLHDSATYTTFPPDHFLQLSETTPSDASRAKFPNHNAPSNTLGVRYIPHPAEAGRFSGRCAYGHHKPWRKQSASAD